MIEEILSKYIKCIKDFEKLIRKEHNLIKNERILSQIGLQFARKGIIKDYHFWFHGSGCSLNIKGTECHYDYFMDDITFSLWAFKQFILTHSEYKNLNFTDKYLELELYRLIEENILCWNTENYVVYQIYHFKH